MRRGSDRAHPDEPGRRGSSHAPDTVPSRSAWTIGYSPRFSRWSSARQWKHALGVPSAPASSGPGGSRIRSLKPLGARMVRTRRRRVTRWIEERCSPLRSSTGWGLTPNWLLNQNHRHRCRLIASRCSGGSGSFGCTPARYGIWPEPTPRWVAAYTWGCCRACSTTPRPRVDIRRRRRGLVGQARAVRRTRTVYRQVGCLAKVQVIEVRPPLERPWVDLARRADVERCIYRQGHVDDMPAEKFVDGGQ